MDVPERQQLCGPVQERVLDLVEALVSTVDWLFFDVLEHTPHPFFLPQSAISTLALRLCGHMDGFQVHHLPNLGILCVIWLGLVG
jgi:hypothetical protein